MSFRLKLTAITVVLGIIVVAVLTFFMTVHNREVLVSNTLKNNQDIVAAIAISLNNYLDELAKTTQTLATSQTIKESVRESNHQAGLLDKSQRTAKIEDLNARWISIEDPDHSLFQEYLSNPIALFLREQKDVIPDLYGEIFLTNKFGALVASTKRLTTFSHGEKYWWLAAYNEGEGNIFFDDRGYDLSVEDFVLGLTVPVYENGRCIGVLKSNMKIFALFNRILEDYLPLYHPGTVKIVRSNGLIVLEPDQKPLSTKISPKILPSLQGEAVSQVYKGENGQEILVSTSPIKNTTKEGSFGFGGDGDSLDQTFGNRGESWAVVLELPKEYVEAVVSKQTKQFLLLGFLSISVISLSSFIFIQRATKGVAKLVDLTHKIGSGDLEAKVRIKTNDEIGELAHSFNQMAARLRETMTSKDELSAEINKRIQVEKRLKHLSRTDDLTQLYNRRAFHDYLQKHIDYTRRYQDPLSIAMLDVDYFKGINDSYGHSVGDSVLVKLSQILIKNIRKADLAARWGGEEFVILMPKTEIEKAFKVCERLRTEIKSTRFTRGISISVSIGVTQFAPEDTSDELIKRVDQALYKAKAKGKDNVLVL
ncbi:MAG: diguanylate cyclase [Firmicutes bacterium]|nr:diguanylate cyclase [Bacillota bacterium]